MENYYDEMMGRLLDKGYSRRRARLHLWWREFLMTDSFLDRKKFHFFCLDCGSEIPWNRILRRKWRYSSCPSCDGFQAHMVGDTEYENLAIARMRKDQ